MDLTDKEYVERCRNGHPNDFGSLVDRYQKPLFSYLSARVDSHPQAEEAAQESFVRAFLSLKKLRKPESFYSWLLGIAGRVAKEQFRATLNRQRDEDAAQAIMEVEDTAASDAAEYPLEEAIATLPESYRQVILLRFFEGLSCQETARRLELPLGTVTKTLSRAYLLLRRDLQARECAQSTVNQYEQP